MRKRHLVPDSRPTTRASAQRPAAPVIERSRRLAGPLAVVLGAPLPACTDEPARPDAGTSASDGTTTPPEYDTAATGMGLTGDGTESAAPTPSTTDAAQDGTTGGAPGTAESGMTSSGSLADCPWEAHTGGQTQHDLAPSEYTLYVPPSYTPDTAVPLVVALHGTGGNGEAWLDQCSIRSTADEYGFIVASPSAWDENLQFGYDESGENAFMDAMLAEVRSCYNVDPSRQYMFGFSQGGFYSIFYCFIGHETTMTACGGFGAHAPWEGFNGQFNDEGRKLPFYLVTGAADSLYIDRARDFPVGLQAAGYPYFFDDPAGLGHACAPGGLGPMYAWWLEQGALH